MAVDCWYTLYDENGNLIADVSEVNISPLKVLADGVAEDGGLGRKFSYQGSKPFLGVSLSLGAATPDFPIGASISVSDGSTYFDSHLYFCVESESEPSWHLIDETKETACRTAEANAIRAKTGGTATISYDFDNGKGFADAIAAIPTGANVKFITRSGALQVNGICYGNGRFVSVFGSATPIFRYSDDGISWTTAATQPSPAYWYAVAYGNGVFVAVGGRYTYTVSAYSTDGINWTDGSLSYSYRWGSITYGKGIFVAQGSGKSAYSTNGKSWTIANMPESGDYYLAYGAGKFVAVGSYNSSSAAYSADGKSWTATTLPASGNWLVAYGSGRFVAVAGSGTVAAYSTDGVNWTPATMPSSGAWTALAYGNGKFVAAVQSGTDAAYSSDGVTWVPITLPTSDSWKIATYGKGKFIIMAAYTGTFLYCDANVPIT